MPQAVATRALPNVLSIGGSDPSGGAGIQADLKTFAALGVYGCAAVSLLTAQNAREMRAMQPVEADFVALQLDAVFDDMEIAAVKIGALGNANVVRAVARVLRATSGGHLLDDEGLIALRRELFPLATVATPNAIEAGVLLGGCAPATLAEMRHSARALHALGAGHVLITGGHVDMGDECVDVLYDGARHYELRTVRVGGPSTHGTGCVLSSAIAALLAQGRTVSEACGEAQRFVAAVIAVEVA